MTTQWLTSWWNLIFIVPFALALLYLGVYTLSGWTFGEADVDADADADVDVHADVDAPTEFHIDHGLTMDSAAAEVDHDIAAEHDADIHHHAGVSAAAGGSIVWGVLNFLGVGKVPLSIVFMILFMIWGTVGFAVNQIARAFVEQPWQVATVSLPAAFIAAVMVTGGVSRMINRFMPLNLSTAKRRHELLGYTGEVILPVDVKFGMASVRDPSGELFQVPCRLERGNGSVPKGAKVKLVAYDARESLYYVLPE